MEIKLGTDPYQTLGVPRTASPAEIKQAYFALVREHSPERDPSGFKRIRTAYEKIKATAARAETDLFLVAEQSGMLTASSLQLFHEEPSPVTMETIKTDLLALEAFLLLEELSGTAENCGNS